MELINNVAMAGVTFRGNSFCHPSFFPPGDIFFLLSFRWYPMDLWCGDGKEAGESYVMEKKLANTPLPVGLSLEVRYLLDYVGIRIVSFSSP